MSVTTVAPAARVAAPTPVSREIAPVPDIPAVAPGQLWLVELPEAAAPVGAARQALDGVNVVIYEPALANTVAQALPLGTYAERAPAKSDAAAARAVHFARDGWSVARVLPARLGRRDRTRRVQDIVDELAAAKIAGRLPVTILACGADGAERIEARFDDLASLVAAHPRDTCLTIVIEAFGGGGAAALHPVAANGLAG